MFSNLRSFLGKSAGQAPTDSFAPYEIDETPSATGGVVFNVDSETGYTVEELAAMQLDYARDIASKFAQVPIKDVVVTVGPYFFFFFFSSYHIHLLENWLTSTLTSYL